MSKLPSAAFLATPFFLGYPYDEAVRRKLHTLLSFDDDANAASNQEGSPDVEVVLGGWGMGKLDEAFFKKFPNTRAVFYAAGSIRGFMTDLAWDRGVRVTTAAKVNATPVAEFTLAQIILSLKQAFSHAVECRRNRTLSRHQREIAGAYGSTVGLLSMGEIARQVASRLAQLEVNVIAYDPFLPASRAAELNVRLCSLEEVFQTADVVSCHTPLLPETTQLIRDSHFRLMKPGATFINTARGGVIAETEMLAVLRERPDIFALLDVTDPEPPVKESPLFDLPNVFLTPHIAGSVDRECVRMGHFIADEVKRYLNHEPLIGEVTRAQAALLA